MAFRKFQNSSELLSSIESATQEILSKEPSEIARVRSGCLRIGTNNQYFTTWDLMNGILRDYSMCTIFPLLKIFEDPRFNDDHCFTAFCLFDVACSNYLRYNGFDSLYDFSEGIKQFVRPGQGTREGAIALIRAFLMYLNRMAAWSFHYFPWGIGKHLTYENPSDACLLATDLSRRVAITSGQRIKITWQPFNITVFAFLATKENPELCEDIMAVLPFTVVQDHAVVSGQSIYAWAPVVSTAIVRVKERQCDAPVGRIRFSQATGQKLIIQYGHVTEDIETPVLGEVLHEYRARLADVGRRVGESTFETKDLIMITVELA